MMSEMVHELVLYILVVSSHAVDRDRKKIMRSSRALQDQLVNTKEDSTLASGSGVKTLTPRVNDSSQLHGNRSISATMKKNEDSPGVLPAAKKKIVRIEKKVPKHRPSVKRSIWSAHHHHAREHIALGGQVSRLSQNAVEATGAVALEIESLPSTSAPTAFVIQSSGAVDVSANPEASLPRVYAPIIDAMQQAPTTGPPMVQQTLAPVAQAVPIVTGAPLATTAAPPPPAAAANSTTTEEGGSGFLGTFFMLLLVGVILVGAAAVILKLRKDNNNRMSMVGGRLGGLLPADGVSGDSQFWRSAKSRQSSRRSMLEASETEEEVSKGESGSEEKKMKSTSSYKDRRSASVTVNKSASVTLNKSGGEDSEADTSRSTYKKSRSRAQGDVPQQEVSKLEVDKQLSVEEDTGKKVSTSQSETDVGATSTYRSRRSQLNSSRNESRGTSRSQARTQSNTDMAV